MKFQRTALWMASLTTLALSTPASASIDPSWHAASIATLPAGSSGVYQGYLPFLACPSPGNCVAGGSYAAGTTQAGLLLNEVGGVWRAPTVATPPSDAAAGSSGSVSLYGVGCGAVGNCSAVGTYYDKSNNVQSFVKSEVGGRWLAATKIVLPANALQTHQSSQVHSIACKAAGMCSAVGTYEANAAPTANIEGFVVDEVNGHWLSAREVALPAGTRGNPNVTLNQVACSSSGNCSAVGSFIDANNITHAIVVNQINRTWRPAISVALPGNASTYAGASLSEVACSTKGSCEAVGTYNTSTGVQGMAVSEGRGAWRRAVQLQLPANAAVNPHVLFFGFQGIACPSPGNCASGGQYIDSIGHYQGFLVNEVGSRWQPATALILPPGSRQASKNGGVVAVSCSSTGNCSAGAAYVDAAGLYQALTINEVNRVWRPGVRLTLPANASGVGIYGGIYSIVCQTNGTCAGIGSYLDASSNYQGFTVSAS
ncbi:MAG: hypothetical protein HIU84_00335 [Acidobacteria bacterium]|nr:hypothetical protein [Acidobacteriota bacterium]